MLMNRTQKKILTVLFIMGFFIVAAFINFGWLGNIVIPDPCAYHNGETEPGPFFRLFYHFPAYATGHPAPTWFN